MTGDLNRTPRPSCGLENLQDHPPYLRAVPTLNLPQYFKSSSKEHRRSALIQQLRTAVKEQEEVVDVLKQRLVDKVSPRCCTSNISL